MFLFSKKAWKETLKNPVIWFFVLILCAMLLSEVCIGCKQVKRERAEQFYDESVKNFPEENK